MCHVEESACCVPLNSHIPGLGQPRQRTQSAGAGNLGLVLLVGSQIRDTSHSIALDLDIGRHHLANQRGQTTALYNENLVLGYSTCQLLKGRSA